MAGISQREREDRQRITDIKLRLKDPALPSYIYAKMQGTLSGLQGVQDRRVAARAVVTAARRAERAVGVQAAAYANGNPYLPDNGRLIVGFVPAAFVSDADTWPTLSAD
jgi:hypothetical protein